MCPLGVEEVTKKKEAPSIKKHDVRKERRKNEEEEKSCW